MGPNEGYLFSMIAIGLAFLLSLYVFFNTKRKWLGCVFQLFSFIGASLILIFLFVMFGIFQETLEESSAMVGVRQVDETRDCRYERTWWMKPDDTYFLIFDKGSNDHRVEPCGNDHYRDKGTFTGFDFGHAIKLDYNPPFVIYFDLNSQKVTPIWDADTLEVVSADWDRIKEYFNTH